MSRAKKVTWVSILAVLVFLILDVIFGPDATHE